MAHPKKHTYDDLATRLIDHADAITNVAAHNLEQDLRDVAKILRELDEPAALIPQLVSELTTVCATTTDSDTRARLRGLLLPETER